MYSKYHFLAISFVCIFYFRKKHLQHKAEKKEWEETLQAEIAKANLRRKQELAEKNGKCNLARKSQPAGCEEANS